MKKFFAIIVTLILVLVIGISTLTTVFAETIYYYYGYYYSYIDNYKVSLCGWNGSTTALFVPGTINDRDVVDISNRAFMDNTTLTEVRFFQSSILERIGSFAFAGCSNISGEISLPSSVAIIETSAFQNCTSLESFVFNSATDVIPNQCFSGCNSLRNVSLKEGVTSIGYLAFADCPNLSYIEIPASVNSIANTAFLNDTITLGVYTNSTAHQYAVNNDIPFILLDAPVVPTEPPTVAPTDAPTEAPTEAPTQAPTDEPTQQPTEIAGYYLGDVNGDNEVDVVDTALIQRYLASIAYPDGCDFTHGDVDHDGSLTILDVTFIGRYLASIEIMYPIGQWVTE